MYLYLSVCLSVCLFVCLSVCVQGDSADCMFFVEDGEIRIAVRQSVGTSECLVRQSVLGTSEW